MSRAGVIAAIDTALSSVSSPTFTAVYVGEPLAIAGTPTAAFWLTSHADDFETLGDVSTTATFTIRCFWRMQTSQDVRETIEDEMWDAIVGIKTALRADSALGGNATDSRPGDATTGYIDLGGITFRQITIPYTVNVYGEYPIAP